MIDYVSAIHQRISRRSYLPAPIEEEKLAVLKQEIEKANQESGLSITFLEDGSEAFEGVKSYGMFSGVRSLIVLKGWEETRTPQGKGGLLRRAPGACRHRPGPWHLLGGRHL